MDFLDPRKRRNHQIRLMIGYALMAVAILLTATILVYWAYGYGFNTKTGGVIENGLLFVDSKPGGASIYLNGKSQNQTTSARMVLAGAAYDLTLKKDGYADWQRRTTVPEHGVLRVVYPFLLPKEPKPQALKSYTALPVFISASPDRHWLLILAENSLAAPSFEMFDMTKPSQPAQVLSLPVQLLNGADRAGSSWTAIEWANDNNHLLLQHAFDGGLEFIMFNRADPAASVNLNRLFNFNPTDATLVNKRADQVYLHSQPDGSLLLADISRASLQPLLKKVLTFKSLGNDLIFYITDQDAAAGQVQARIWSSAKTYKLTNLPAGAKYFIEAANFQSHWYYVAGSDQSKRINIYKDPLDGLKDPARAVANPLISLTNSNVGSLSKSDNSRFLGAQDGQHFAVFDIENQTRYQFNLPSAAQVPLKWMDGHRWVGNIDGSVFIMDFDSQNPRKFIPTATDDVWFDRDYNRLFSLLTAPGGVTTVLQMTDLRAGADLPKTNQ